MKENYWGKKRVRIGRATDSQRQKVYSLEKRIFSTAYQTTAVPEEVGLQLRRAARRFRVSVPSHQVKRMIYSGPLGRYRPARDRITLYIRRGNGVSAGTVIHEFSHHLCGYLYGDWVAWHGPEFFRCLLEVMKWAGYYKGRYSQRQHRVKVAGLTEFWERVRARSRRS